MSLFFVEIWLKSSCCVFISINEILFPILTILFFFFCKKYLIEKTYKNENDINTWNVICFWAGVGRRTKTGNIIKNNKKEMNKIGWSDSWSSHQFCMPWAACNVQWCCFFILWKEGTLQNFSFVCESIFFPFIYLIHLVTILLWIYVLFYLSLALHIIVRRVFMWEDSKNLQKMHLLDYIFLY